MWRIAHYDTSKLPVKVSCLREQYNAARPALCRQQLGMLQHFQQW
jgi:hypothetical protein